MARYTDFANLSWPAAGFCLVLCFGSAGCGTVPFSDTVFGPSYQPTNVFRLAPQLPANVHRVALLPFVPDARRPVVASGQESLEPVLQSEIQKTKRFELVPISPDQLRQWTGQGHWAGDEKLPQDFFKVLAEETGAEAVLFAQLSEFQPYPPLAVGWRLKLVECAPQRVLWAVDEVFNAGETAVANGARRFQQTQQRSPGALLDSTGILNSPRRFGQYAAATVAATLPQR